MQVRSGRSSVATTEEGTRGTPLQLDLIVVGGCGHVGLPLALVFADAGLKVGILDVDRIALKMVGSGEMPFQERGADEVLRRVLPTGRIELSDDIEMLGRADVALVVVGTPLDEFMNPSMRAFDHAIDDIVRHLRPGTLLILRSTVFPGTTMALARKLSRAGFDLDVAFCPERIAEGHALEELRGLPQLVGAVTDRGYERAAAFFSRLAVEVIRTSPDEAELAKLFTNAWRYIKFAVANQFFEIAHVAGVDYDKVLTAIRYRYPRAADLPAPGFAAGPCLLKDTMQLAAFTPDHFPLGHSAMLVNEGLPNYIVDSLEARRPLLGRTVGILGMAFKGESDDSRSSLAWKLRKLLEHRGADVLCTDPYVRDSRLLPLDTVLERAEILVIGAPHRPYRDLDLTGREVADVWNVTGTGIQL
jgi:UDP-N-acetyl-D-mannosaminuronic acid dehydrogenase